MLGHLHLLKIRVDETIPAMGNATLTCQRIAPITGQSPERFDYLRAAPAATTATRVTAHARLQQWKHTPQAQRAAIVNKASALMLEHADDFARLAMREMRKRMSAAREEVRHSAEILAHHATHAEGFLTPVNLHPRYGAAFLQGSPLGLLFCSEPWHFPFYQLACIAGPQLMAGHTVSVQHPGYVPSCAIAFEKLWADAGAPAGIYTNRVVLQKQSDEVIDVPRLKDVAPSGSVAVESSLKKSAMELGGSDAFIVLDDADLDKAIPWAVRGRMYNVGQTCCAAQRFIVVESVADAFLEGFKAAVKGLTAGVPMNEKALSTEAVLARLLAQVDAALQGKTGWEMGGRRIDRPGPYMQVTVLTDIQPGGPVFRDEFFGPVVSFHRVKDEVAAIALARDTQSGFGLGGSVWTEDTARGKRVSDAVRSGRGGTTAATH